MRSSKQREVKSWNVQFRSGIQNVVGHLVYTCGMQVLGANGMLSIASHAQTCMGTVLQWREVLTYQQAVLPCASHYSLSVSLRKRGISNMI